MAQSMYEAEYKRQLRYADVKQVYINMSSIRAIGLMCAFVPQACREEDSSKDDGEPGRPGLVLRPCHFTLSQLCQRK